MIIPIQQVGALGVFRDLPSHELPMNAWSDGGNFRFYKKNATRILGHEQVFSTPTVVPGFLFNVPAPASSFWFYFSLAKAYVYDGGVHTNVTRAAGDYTATAYRDWNGCLLGGVPVFNNGTDIPQYWSALSVGTPLIALANWTSTLRAKIIRNFGPFLVALNLNDNGTLLPHSLQWSHPADPGTVPTSWDYTSATVDAGRTHLTDVEGGSILDARLLGDSLLIYKKASTHLMRFIGGANIMGFNLLLGSGILNTRCVCSIRNGNYHFVVTQDDVITHTGTRNAEPVLQEKDKDYLFADMDSTNYVNAFAFDNPAFKEAWFCYPASGATYPNKVMIWNYQYDTVTFRDWAGTTAALGDYTDSTGTQWNSLSGTWDSQTWQWSTQAKRKLLFGDPAATKIYGLDTGYFFGAAAPSVYLERTGLILEKGDTKYTSRFLIKRIWPKWRGSSVLSVRLGAQEELDSSIIWQSPKVFDSEQKYLDFEAVGRYPAVRFEASDASPGQLEGYDLEVQEISNL